MRDPQFLLQSLDPACQRSTARALSGQVMLIQSQLGMVPVAFDVDESPRLALTHEQFGGPVLRSLQRLAELALAPGGTARLAIGVMEPVLQQLHLMRWRAAGFQRRTAQAPQMLDDGLGGRDAITMLGRLNQQVVNEIPGRNTLAGQEAR